MYTLDNTVDTKLTHQQERTIALRFPSDVLDYQEGAVVALDPATEKIIDIATGVYPIGFIATNNGRYLEGGVVVQTPFVAVCKGKADGVVAAGDLLEATSWDEVNGYTAYKKAAAGTWAVAYAIKGNTDGLVMTAGILKSPTAAI